MRSASALRLRARDVEDMGIIAAFLQDALVPLSEIAFQRRKGRFVFVANRFRWEAQQDGDSETDSPGAAPAGPARESEGRDARFHEAEDGRFYERVNSGVRFGNVTGVQARGLDLKARDQILNLLTIDATPEAITLVFSGDAAIRLRISAIDCRLEDIGEPWPTAWRPIHKLDATDPGR